MKTNPLPRSLRTGRTSDESVASLVEDVSVVTLDLGTECRIGVSTGDSRAFGSRSIIIEPI